MKQLKSTLDDLRQVFERSITLKHIAEPLSCFASGTSAANARQYMEDQDFDVLGVTSRNLVSGYVQRSICPHGKVADHLTAFAADDIVDENWPLADVFNLLGRHPRVFLTATASGTVTQIVTRGDLQKAPVRMWLFGLVSLIEMHFLRLIRKYDESDEWWIPIAGKNGLKKAREILADRRLRNLQIDLADCLEFPHKGTILLKTPPLAMLAGLKGGKPGARFIRRLTELRNNLAHSNDIITGYWPGIIDLVRDAEALLSSCERAAVPIKGEGSWK